MGECCSNGKYPEEKKIFESFEKIDKENIDGLNIINYEDKIEAISHLYKNTFDKLGQFHSLRFNFIKELKNEITKEKSNNMNYNNPYLSYNNMYNRTNYNNSIRYNNETQRILYHLIIMTLILKNYLNRKYISNELEMSLLDLSAVIINKKYNNLDLKLILFYTSKMFEILFINVKNIINFINLKDYLSKISLIAENNNILAKEEKYLFIKTHIISLGQLFHNEYKMILIESSFRFLLLKYYSYLFLENFDFIIENQQIFVIKKNDIDIRFIQDYYNEKDLIQPDNINDKEYGRKKEDLYKISYSIHYFFIICTEDIFTGKNIFYEFDRIIEQKIIENKLQNNTNIIKFKKSLFHILFKNVVSADYTTTMLFSFLDYIIEYQKLGPENSDNYYKMIIELYGRFNYNRIFLDKYSSFISQLFIMEIEKNKKEKMILTELYKYINELKNKNYNNLDAGNIKIKNYENIFFFNILFKNISSQYKHQKNINIINDILVYLNNFLSIIRKDYKNQTSNIINYNDKFLYENINFTLKNFNFSQNEYNFQFNQNLQTNLMRFLSSYILMINDLFHIDYKDIKIDFDHSIIYSITILEIKIIKYNRMKSMNKIIELLNIIIKHLNSKYINDHEEINNYLKNNLKLIKNQTYTYNSSYINIQFTTIHLKIIYIILILILYNINKNNIEKQKLISKHNKILLKINQFNKIIGSCFKNLSNVDSIKVININKLLQGQIYAITHISFIQIIKIIEVELFNEKEEYLSNNFRSRTLYQNDKNSEMSININTKKNFDYNTKTHLLNNNFLINDSFSKFSNDTLSIRRVNNKLSSNYNNINYNNDIFSEKIKMPYKDNLSYNEKMNINNINTNEDIISNKSSLINCELRI